MPRLSGRPLPSALLAMTLAAAAVAALPRDTRASTALVLSGGGSRGTAHGGVLVALERRGIDPDLVIGTSMGAIVGALYAAGYDAETIWGILESEDWRGIFTPFPVAFGPDRAVRYPVLGLSTDGHSSFVARGYVPDWQINRVLVELLFDASARSGGDFDRLARRFRAVAGDLDTGDFMALGSGDLPLAVRASMAASGFFAPVRWGARRLIDGGVADYLPVDEARRLGADTVIAVDVLRPPPRAHSLDALAVARRNIELMAMRIRLASGPADILILPDLPPSLTPMVYPIDARPQLQAGLDAALAKLPPLEDGVDTSLRRHRELPPRPENLIALSVEAPQTPLDAFVRRAFQGLAPGRYEPRRIHALLDRLYATGLFDGIWPSVQTVPGAEDPELTVRVDARGPVSLTGGLGYDNDRGGRIWSSLRRVGAIRSTAAEVALEGAANGVEQWAGMTGRFTSPRAPQLSGTAGVFLREYEPRFVEVPGDAGDPEIKREGGWVGVDWRRLDPDRHASLTLRAENVHGDAGEEGGSFGPSFRIGRTPLLVEVVGTPPSFEADFRFGGAGYWRLRAKGSVARSRAGLTGAVLGDVVAVSSDAPLDAAPALGDDYAVPGLRWGERPGQRRAAFGVDLGYPVALKGTLRLRLRGGVIDDTPRLLPAPGGSGGAGPAEPGEPLRVRYDGDPVWIFGAGFSGLWWTPFGRIEAGLEASTAGDRRILVSLGPDF